MIVVRLVVLVPFVTGLDPVEEPWLSGLVLILPLIGLWGKLDLAMVFCAHPPIEGRLIATHSFAFLLLEQLIIVGPINVVIVITSSFVVRPQQRAANLSAHLVVFTRVNEVHGVKHRHWLKDWAEGTIAR